MANYMYKLGKVITINNIVYVVRSKVGSEGDLQIDLVETRNFLTAFVKARQRESERDA